MTMIIRTAKIQKLTKKEWENENPVLYDGTLVYEKDTKRFKLGDGYTPYKDLDYVVDPMTPMMYSDLMTDNAVREIFSIISFVATAMIWGLLSIINWVSELSFIWQFIGCGIIYYVIFTILNLRKK